MDHIQSKIQHMAYNLIGKTDRDISPTHMAFLLYLSDRAAIDQYEMPMSGDKMINTSSGPALSLGLELQLDESDQVTLFFDSGQENIGVLSPEDEEILDAIWEEFGEMGEHELLEWAYGNCVEWRNEDGTEITIEAVLLALGRDSQIASMLAKDIEEKIRVRELGYKDLQGLRGNDTCAAALPDGGMVLTDEQERILREMC